MEGRGKGGMLEPQPSSLSPPTPRHHPLHEALLLISLPKKETQLETHNIQLAHHVENS